MIVPPMILSLVCGVVLIEGYSMYDTNSNLNTNMNTNRRSRAPNRHERKFPRDWMPIEDYNGGSQRAFEQMNDGYYDEYVPRIKMASLKAANAAISIMRSRAEDMAESVAYAIGDAIARILTAHYENSIPSSRRSTNYNKNLNTNFMGRGSPDERDQEFGQVEGDLGRSSTMDMADLDSLLGYREEKSPANLAAKSEAYASWNNRPDETERIPYGYSPNIIRLINRRNDGVDQNGDEIAAALPQTIEVVGDNAENDGVTDSTQASEILDVNGEQVNANDNKNTNRRSVNVNSNFNNLNGMRRKHGSRYHRD